jgi:hypothetical protein
LVGIAGDVTVEHVCTACELPVHGDDLVDAREHERSGRAGAVVGNRVVDQVEVAIEVGNACVGAATLAMERRCDLAAARPTAGMTLELRFAVVPSQRFGHARRQPRDLGLDRSRSGHVHEPDAVPAHREHVELDTPAERCHQRLEMEAVADDRERSARLRQPDRRRPIGARQHGEAG